jgi:hypothetical protein
VDGVESEEGRDVEPVQQDGQGAKECGFEHAKERGLQSAK